MLCVAGPLPFCFRTVPDLCQASLLSRSLPLWPASPHLRAHTQKNTQWFITAAWKGWIIHLGIPKSWVCCSFITCSALDYRQLPFPSSLSLMGQQVFNTLCYSLFTYPPQIWLHSVYVCMCFNDLLAKLLHKLNHVLLPNQSSTHQQTEPITLFWCNNHNEGPCDKRFRKRLNLRKRFSDKIVSLRSSLCWSKGWCPIDMC